MCISISLWCKFGFVITDKHTVCQRISLISVNILPVVYKEHILLYTWNINVSSTKELLLLLVTFKTPCPDCTGPVTREQAVIEPTVLPRLASNSWSCLSCQVPWMPGHTKECQPSDAATVSSEAGQGCLLLRLKKSQPLGVFLEGSFPWHPGI